MVEVRVCLVELVENSFLELNVENKDAEFMMDYDRRKTVKVAELIPYWWGEERASKFNEQ